MPSWTLYTILTVLAVAVTLSMAMTFALAREINGLKERFQTRGPRSGTAFPMEEMVQFGGAASASTIKHILVLAAHCHACSDLLVELSRYLPDRGRATSSVAVVWIGSSDSIPAAQLHAITPYVSVFTNTEFPPLTDKIGLEYTPSILSMGPDYSIDAHSPVTVERLKTMELGGLDE